MECGDTADVNEVIIEEEFKGVVEEIVEDEDKEEDKEEEEDDGSTTSTESYRSDKDIVDKYENVSLKSNVSKLIVKSVFKGSIPNRETLVSFMRLRFKVQGKVLTSLTPSQINETFAKKLLKHSYVKIADKVSIDRVGKGDIKVETFLSLSTAVKGKEKTL